MDDESNLVNPAFRLGNHERGIYLALHIICV